MLFATMVISAGCCSKEIQYVDRNVTVNVPVKCIAPDTFCSEYGSIKSNSVVDLLTCISELRESNKFCK